MVEGNINKRSKAANDDTWFYAFDHLNRLVSAELRATDDPDGTLLHKEEYDFDVFGNRIAKRVDSDGDGNWDTTERFAYNGNMVWADLDASNNLTVRRMYGDVIDQVFARIGSAGAAWYLTDRLGSVVNIVNNSGTILNTTTYDSFGTPTDSNSANADRYKHTGREWNAVVESGYFRARNTMAGRFMQEDRVVDDPTNKYRYVRNNPLMAIDPYGLSSTPLPLRPDIEAGLEVWNGGLYLDIIKRTPEDELTKASKQYYKPMYDAYSELYKRLSTEDGWDWKSTYGVSTEAGTRYDRVPQLVQAAMDKNRNLTLTDESRRLLELLTHMANPDKKPPEVMALELYRDYASKVGVSVPLRGDPNVQKAIKKEAKAYRLALSAMLDLNKALGSEVAKEQKRDYKLVVDTWIPFVGLVRDWTQALEYLAKRSEENTSLIKDAIRDAYRAEGDSSYEILKEVRKKARIAGQTILASEAYLRVVKYAGWSVWELPKTGYSNGNGVNNAMIEFANDLYHDLEKLRKMESVERVEETVKKLEKYFAHLFEGLENYKELMARAQVISLLTLGWGALRGVASIRFTGVPGGGGPAVMGGGNVLALNTGAVYVLSIEQVTFRELTHSSRSFQQEVEESAELGGGFGRGGQVF